MPRSGRATSASSAGSSSDLDRAPHEGVDAAEERDDVTRLVAAEVELPGSGFLRARDLGDAEPELARVELDELARLRLPVGERERGAHGPHARVRAGGDRVVHVADH